MPHNRTAAACTILALTASGLLVATPTNAHVADMAKTTKSFKYKCKVKAGGMVINPAAVKTTVSAKLPSSIEAGSTLRRRAVTVKVAMPDVIRDNAVSVLRAKKASGSAPKAHLGVKINKSTSKVAVKNLTAPKRKIPRKGTWTITAKGKVGKVRIPAKASGSAKISVPKRLRIKAKLFRRNGSKLKAGLTCKAPKKRVFGTVSISG